MFNYVVVGAGFSGAVISRLIAEQLDQKVLLVESRNHVGGNCYDYMNSHGILVHEYGPHLFHTNNKKVVDFLSRFTEWTPYQHKVLADVDGRKIPVPFNLNSIEKLFPANLASCYIDSLTRNFGYNTRVPILELRSTNDELLNLLADYVYDKIYSNYTKKQWGVKPEDINPEVTSRVPVYVGKDDRYFHDTYQMMPQKGYTALFSRMLDHPNIKLMLNTNFKEIMGMDIDKKETTLFGSDFKGELIYTGAIDELFDNLYGSLPYRSIDFKFETLNVSRFQEATTINYPNNYSFTRITEFKHFQFTQNEHTTIVHEYPKDYIPGVDIPYYPVFTDETHAVYNQYNKLASTYPNLHCIGRLAQYKYFDMDDAVANAMKYFESTLNSIAQGAG